MPYNVESFKRALAATPALDMVRQYLLSDDCYLLEREEHLKLRDLIAREFNCHPNEIIIVGSAKLGFSIAPGKTFREFSDDSDIDIAIVSRRLFDKVWYAVFEYHEHGGYWEKLDDFSKYLFKGWIRPDMLPPENSFDFCKQWWKFFNQITSSGRFGTYKIRAGLYRSWYFLESYHQKSIEMCKGGT